MVLVFIRDIRVGERKTGCLFQFWQDNAARRFWLYNVTTEPTLYCSSKCSFSVGIAKIVMSSGEGDMYYSPY
jgi:hypothetical protein